MQQRKIRGIGSYQQKHRRKEDTDANTKWHVTKNVAKKKIKNARWFRPKEPLDLSDGKCEEITRFGFWWTWVINGPSASTTLFFFATQDCHE